MPYATIVLISLPLKKGATLKSLPFGKWRFREEEVRRMGQKQKRIRQKERQKKEQKRSYIYKWDQTNSPEIPDRRETSESPAYIRRNSNGT